MLKANARVLSLSAKPQRAICSKGSPPMKQQLLFVLGLSCLTAGCGTKTAPPQPTLSVVGRDMLWRNHMEAGVKADAARNPAEAEREFKAAVAEAETIGPRDRRVATSLNQLAQHYAEREEFAKAEPLFKQALAIW